MNTCIYLHCPGKLTSTKIFSLVIKHGYLSNHFSYFFQVVSSVLIRIKPASRIHMKKSKSSSVIGSAKSNDSLTAYWLLVKGLHSL